MGNIEPGNIKDMGIYFKTINMNDLCIRPEVELSQMHIMNDEKKKKILKEKREKIEYRMVNVLTNSEENVKSTVHVINNVNKQLIQNNLLLKMKIENMKQIYKNILNYCDNLKSEIDLSEDDHLHQVLNNIIGNLKSELHKTRED